MLSAAHKKELSSSTCLLCQCLEANKAGVESLLKDVAKALQELGAKDLPAEPKTKEEKHNATQRELQE